MTVRYLQVGDPWYPKSGDRRGVIKRRKIEFRKLREGVIGIARVFILNSRVIDS